VKTKLPKRNKLLNREITRMPLATIYYLLSLMGTDKRILDALSKCFTYASINLEIKVVKKSV